MLVFIYVSLLIHTNPYGHMTINKQSQEQTPVHIMNEKQTNLQR